MPPGTHGPAQLRVQRLDGVGSVDDPANLVGEGEERDHLRPGPSPALADGGIAGAPGTGLEDRQCLLGRLGAGRAVDFLQRRRQTLAVLPRDEVHRVSQQVDDARLDDRVGKHRGDRLGKTLQAVDDGEQDILGAAVPELVHDPEPEFGAQPH